MKNEQKKKNSENKREKTIKKVENFSKWIKIDCVFISKKYCVQYQEMEVKRRDNWNKNRKQKKWKNITRRLGALSHIATKKTSCSGARPKTLLSESQIRFSMTFSNGIEIRNWVSAYCQLHTVYGNHHHRITMKWKNNLILMQMKQ